MEKIEILYGVIAILSFLLLWFGKMLFAQKSIVDSFKAQSGGVKDLQDMLLTQIKPENINNIVDRRVEVIEIEYKRKIDEIQSSRKEAATKTVNILKDEIKTKAKFATIIAFFKFQHPETYKKYSMMLDDKEIEEINYGYNELILRVPPELIKLGKKLEEWSQERKQK